MRAERQQSQAEINCKNTAIQLPFSLRRAKQKTNGPPTFPQFISPATCVRFAWLLWSTHIWPQSMRLRSAYRNLHFSESKDSLVLCVSNTFGDDVLSVIFERLTDNTSPWSAWLQLKTFDSPFTLGWHATQPDVNLEPSGVAGNKYETKFLNVSCKLGGSLFTSVRLI